MSESKPLLVVTGATGLQGGSVIEYALKDGGFRLRGITRNPDSPAAQKLANQGVEVVKASLDDVASLTEAFKGADLAFGLTDFWQFYLSGSTQYNSEASQAAETKHGKAIVDAVKASGKDTILLYSSLDHSDVSVPHFESKVDVAKYRKEQKVRGAELMTSWYYSNVWKFGGLSKGEDGVWTLSTGLPSDAPVFSYAPEETGGWALPFFKNPEKYLEQELPACSEYITSNQLGKAIEEATGQKIKVAAVTKNQFFTEDFKKAIGEEIWLNYRLFVENPRPDSRHGRNLEESRKLFPDASNAKTYFGNSEELKQFLNK